MEYRSMSNEERDKLDHIGAILRRETRDFQSALDPQGGYTVLSEEIADEILVPARNQGGIFQVAKVIEVPSAQSWKLPILKTDFAEATWSGEIVDAPYDTTAAFEALNLIPHRVTFAVKVSNDLIRLSRVQFADWVMTQLRERLLNTLEDAFVNGNGVGKPTGLFTTGAGGITSGRNYLAGNSATGVTADNIIGNYFNLRAGYLQAPSLRWVISRALLQRIRTLKTGDGQYIWTAGLSDATGPRIMGVPYILNEWVPTTFAASQRVGLIGDLSKYVIAMAKEVELKVIDQLLALSNQTVFLCSAWLDAGCALPEAFSVITLAT